MTDETLPTHLTKYPQGGSGFGETPKKSVVQIASAGASSKEECDLEKGMGYLMVKVHDDAM